MSIEEEALQATAVKALVLFTAIIIAGGLIFLIEHWRTETNTPQNEQKTNNQFLFRITPENVQKCKLLCQNQQLTYININPCINCEDHKLECICQPNNNITNSYLE